MSKGIKKSEQIKGRPKSSAQTNLTPVIQSGERAVVSYDPLQIYLSEIRKYPMLTREEEIELATRIREDGDEKAAYRMATSNLRLVVKIAMDYHRYWTKNLLDLIQEGNLGLLQAVKKFDPYRGIKFSYYASFWIKAYMLKFIMDNWKIVKIGTTQSQRKLFFNLSKEKNRLLAEGFDPEPKLLAERLDVEEKDVIEMSQRLGNWEISLNAPINDDYKDSYEALLSDPGIAVDEQLSTSQNRDLLIRSLKKFRKKLTGKEADIFDNRIMSENPMTLQQLGDRYHISRERIRQIQERIIKKIEKTFTEEISNFEEEYSGYIK